MAFNAYGSLALAAALCVALPVAAADGDQIVTIAGGKVQGHADKGATAFLGIPYGADTGGARRFLPPAPAPAWPGVKVADLMGARCPQPPLNGPRKTPQVILFAETPISEDCLFLNVWTPKPGPGKRPVMVWLHGGGFAFGSAADKYYEGANLSRGQDVVVVSLNHRLNAFGFVNLGPEAGPEYAASGDVGMLDIVQALQWVRDNIAAFGGDPDNVTIFGQSGGGGKVTVLLAMPAAHGLFQKAIIESGADIRVNTAEEALTVRNHLLAALNLKPEDAAKLKTVPMQDLILAALKSGILTYRPMVDGAVLPAQPFDPVATTVSADVPVMVGTARDEATDMLLADPAWPGMTDAQLEAKASAAFGDAHGKAVLALYRSRAPTDKPMHIWASIITDQNMRNKAITLASRKAAQHAAPVYAYRIDWNSPVLGGILRAPHGVELPFVFDNVDVSGELVGAGPTHARMAKLMSGMFAQFARTGNPNLAGYPHWPAYDDIRRATFIFDIPPHVVSDPDSKVRMFWGVP